jgi:Arc/MetJ family transcription regulator
MTIVELIDDLALAAEEYGRYSEASRYAEGAARHLVNEKIKECLSERRQAYNALLNAIRREGVDTGGSDNDNDT